MKQFFSMKDLPASERPYEKCESDGAAALSDAELIAVILRTGSKETRSTELAAKILSYSNTYPGLRGISRMTQKDFMSIHGIGRVKAIQLLCLTELSIRMAKATFADGIRYTDPNSVAEYYMQEMRSLKTEQSRLLMFDTKSKLLREEIISIGTVNASIMSPREIFLLAVKYEAVYIILLHNHPSGDPTPSKEDIAVTKRMKEAGELLGVTLMDHIIIGDNRYISLKEQGIILAY
ncbi:MAG TPA: hypothetical protein DHW61_07845 [Lachnoclostridium phytofermentans]|uniref:MPN domain-containing protein n=1 Tax=Lachnoclostridium phytofermentans TaxID=66219 RepID=A0A3D2X5D4_9FIRM|nr:DNA repair protein RadC [Lachnoclostridium sp.]HCL02312.1 hypothetical protein [Lachnoclostridium phytofermentans]